MKRQSNQKHVIGCFSIFLLVLIALTAMLCKSSPESSNVNTNPIIANFAKQHNIPTSAWPEELIALLEKNPETQDFVLNYPIKKGTFSTANLDEYKNSDSVPLLLQWDERWGYFEYAGELMGLSGCGPVCLSMVCIHLLNDTSLTPPWTATEAAGR